MSFGKRTKEASRSDQLPTVEIRPHTLVDRLHCSKPFLIVAAIVSIGLTAYAYWLLPEHRPMKELIESIPLRSNEEVEDLVLSMLEGIPNYRLNQSLGPPREFKIFLYMTDKIHPRILLSDREYSGSLVHSLYTSDINMNPFGKIGLTPQQHVLALMQRRLSDVPLPFRLVDSAHDAEITQVINFHDRDSPRYRDEHPISQHLPTLQLAKDGGAVTQHTQFGRWSRRQWWTQGGKTIGGMELFAYSNMMAAQELAAASRLAVGESSYSVANKIRVPQKIKTSELGHAVPLFPQLPFQVRMNCIGEDAAFVPHPVNTAQIGSNVPLFAQMYLGSTINQADETDQYAGDSQCRLVGMTNCLSRYLRQAMTDRILASIAQFYDIISNPNRTTATQVVHDVVAVPPEQDWNWVNQSILPMNEYFNRRLVDRLAIEAFKIRVNPEFYRVETPTQRTAIAKLILRRSLSRISNMQQKIIGQLTLVSSCPQFVLFDDLLLPKYIANNSTGYDSDEE
jgi:hypothetical protein